MNPGTEQQCNFQLKKGRTAFQCDVCMVDSFDAERYICNDCSGHRHKGCFKLAEEIKLGPNGFLNGVTLQLFNEPQKRKDSKNGNWANYCLVCGMAIVHYSYHCQVKDKYNNKLKDLNMHPCCAELARAGSPLPRKMRLAVGKSVPRCVACGDKLPKGASPDGPIDSFCWSYMLEVDRKKKKSSIHVYCYSQVVIQELKRIPPSGNIISGKVCIRPNPTKDDGSIKSWIEIVAEELRNIALDQLGGWSLN